MEYFHLTTPQQNIWNLQKYYSDTSIANLCGATFYREKRDSGFLQQAIRQFIQNQSGIRLRFCEGEKPLQYVSDEMEENIPVKTFSSMKEFDRYAEEFAATPLELMGKFQYRFVVFHVENKSGILVLLSHLVSDAWTFGLLAKQVDVAYHKLAGDGENAEKISLIKADYTTYIYSEDTYLASAKYKKDKEYWEGKYAVRPEESLMKLMPALSKSIAAQRLTRVLPLAVEQKMDTFCRENSVTPAVLFETALVVYLYRINPENASVTLGVPVLNRSNAKEKEIAGMFVSTMPLTVAVGGDMTGLELAKQIGKEHMSIFRHQKYPYANILKYLREKHSFSGNLYSAMMSYQNAKTDTQADTKWYSNGFSEVPFAMHIDNRDGNNSHTINVDYQTAVFNEEEIEYIVKRLEYILMQITEDGNGTIKDMDILPEQEREKIVCEFNDTYVDYPRDKCVHELFTEQAERTPDKVALVFEDKKFTYRQLDEMSNSLAHFLREKGVRSGDKVIVLIERDMKIIIAQLAVLKLGAVFVPIDNKYPQERIKYILLESNAKIIIKNKKNKLSFRNQCNIEEWIMSKRRKIEYPKIRMDDACYIIFTSGSTGQPKGCVLTNRGLANFCINNNILSECNQLEQKICISVNTVSFDFFIAESLLPLLNGYTVVLASEKESENLKSLKRLILKNNVNIIQTTPTRYRMYFSNEEDILFLKKFQIIVTSGEAFPFELLKKFVSNSNAKIFNPLGPSECSVWVAGGELNITLGKATAQDITIGKPIANTQIYILDPDSNPVPIGVPGELCIAGEGVGKGYLNRPELTAERFVPNPFATKENRHGKVMYHTGDLARWRADGEIEYLGRMDTQVKIRGLRIELGEIESVMGTMAGIGFAAVADKRDEDNRQYLVGYYMADTEIDEPKLREHLASKLPKYMVPNFFMRLDTMPMTPSGKIDRKNLPTPDVTVQKNEYIAPITDTEKKLAAIWQQAFHMEKVGRTDDFYELGGDSLMAIVLVSEIDAVFQVEISVKDVLERSNLEQLAQCIEEAGGRERIEARGEKKYILLPQQKAIYAAYSKDPAALTYNMPARIRLSESVDRERLKQSIYQVIENHKILKSHIRAEEDEIYGIYDENIPVIFEDYETGEENSFIRPFCLENDLLIRIGFTEKELLFDMHHIIADGDSLNIILCDIVTAYIGKGIKMPKVQYSDYARYFYELDMEEGTNYFKEMLKCDFEPVILPETKNPGKGGKSKLYHLPEEVFGKAKEYAEKNGLTDTMVFLGAFGILLSKFTAGKDILTSIILQNRTHSDTKDMVGMFVNTLPLYLAVKGSMPEYMGTVKQILLNLFQYQELPFWNIANAVGMKDKSVVNTSFVYQGDGEKAMILDGQELVPQFMDTHAAKFDLTMELTPLKDGCRIRMEYSLAKYDGQLMDKLMDAYVRILSQLDKEDVADISVLLEGEFYQVTETFNDTYVDYPRDKCVHELFSEQAERTPDKVALVFEDKKFTYRQLDEMSNSLAYFLREKGVKPNDVVPVIARRSWHVIVAMIGVLKAGGAYMPVSPDYPEDRILHMLSEVKAYFALTYDYKGKSFTQSDVDLLSINYQGNTDKIANVNTNENWCYLLFTSGSTGKPKAVLISHRNLGNFVTIDNKNSYQTDMVRKGNCVLADTIFSFDISIFEIILPLLNGLTVVLTKDAGGAEYLAELIEKNKVDVLHITPTKLLMLLHSLRIQKAMANLKLIMVGAETLTKKTIQEIGQYTDAVLYNGYGPTETTIGCCFKRIEKKISKQDYKYIILGDDITIGKPIANTQIYILDTDSNPVSIGVPGELCIAGEGVGKGYLNQPELTAERFVPNPFATKENRHGKVMYHTGDLARWRADGEIEYLGRMDTQVKIRGLRIELGEIESVMGTMEGIGLTAVADKRDEDGRQYLVGYYTADTEIDERKLREHLASKLPKYMIPNFFMRLDAIPMTPSGKTDRKNLPTPAFVVQAGEYVAPSTEQEKVLCHLLEELLGMERVGIQDDFFEMGGDSLRAIEFMAKAHSMGIDFPLQSVFDYPTVQSLCGFMQKEDVPKVRFEASDFDKYQELFQHNRIEDNFVPEKHPLGNVLLTGATGFLGAHVLDALMREEEGKIYCLVRCGKKDNDFQRVRDIFKYYFGNQYEDDIGERIILIPGDIEREELAENMPADVQTVIHTAASVSHYGSYRYFRRVNVEGTRHVINYAMSVGARLIHISTLSVSGNSMADDFTVYRSKEEKYFYETSLYIGQPLDNVYIHSKFEAEMAVYDAMLKGLDAKVIRVGNLTNRVTDYKFQPNYTRNAFLTRMKAVLEFGLFPDYLMPLYSEFSPVDLTAEGIVKIAQYADGQNVFHLNSDRPIYYERFLEVIRKLGIPMDVVEGSKFHQALEKTVQSAGKEYIFQALQNDMDEKGRLVYDSNIRIMNEFTVWFLKKVGFRWNETDFEYIRGYVEYFRKLGYLEV